MEKIKGFHVVTESLSVYRVCLDEKSIVAIKVYLKNRQGSRAQLGYELGPGYQFLSITQKGGLRKVNSPDGKKPRDTDDGFIGKLYHTSDIIGLFLLEKDAVNFCERQTNPHYNETWHKKEEAQEILSQIKNHPLVLIDKRLLEEVSTPMLQEAG